MGSQEFSSLPLHDALLKSVEIDWEKKTCRIEVAAFVEANAWATPHQLLFSGVTSLSVPHEEPWGPSSSVNATSQDNNRFQIEMQSGDIIEVAATSFAFSAL
jgi:hypothetical protein